MMTPNVRRVVTGCDERGRSAVLSDEPCSNTVRPPARHGVTIGHLWETYAGGNDDGTPDRSPIALKTPPGGTLFRVVDFPPDDAWADHLDMHRTATIDYAIVLSGEAYLVLDTTETLMRAGDTAIQRGVNHAWSNRSSQVCRVFFAMIDAPHE